MQLEHHYLRKIAKRRDEIARFLWREVVPITDVEMRETSLPGGDHADVRQPEWTAVQPGHQWGGRPWVGAELRLRFAMPASMAGQRVYLLLNIGGEGCVFRGGRPWHGVDGNHQELLLEESAAGGAAYDLLVEATSPETYRLQPQTATFTRADLAVPRGDLADLYLNLSLLWELAQVLPEGGARRPQIVRALNQAVDAFDLVRTDDASLTASCARAAAILAPVLRRSANASEPTFCVQGQSHMDVAWLWPLDETVRKCARTFSTALRTMEEYPHYLFSHSQPQLYEYARLHYPELFAEVKQRIADGRWEVVGGMWVEPDCNIPSGEALVRQLLLGKLYIREQLGTDTDVTWLPDVFGYNAALPQILAKAGVPYFFTTKISWSQFNKPEQTIFWWEGIDGTRVLAHYPACVYANADLGPRTLVHAVASFPERDRYDEAIVSYGHGDGGGGPDRRQLEFGRREQNLEGLPRVVHRRVGEFFHRAARRAKDLTTWQGELYLEYHRGTFTTQARTKRHNRRAELLLREAEMLAALEWALGGTYPHAELDDAWKTLLLQQFHDILPGSSIGAVYVDSERDFARVREVGEGVLAHAQEALARRINTAGSGRPVIVWNSLGWDCVGLCEVDADRAATVLDPEGKPVPVQRVVRDGRERLLFRAEVPSIGYAVHHLAETAAVAPLAADLTVTPELVESPFLRLQLDDQGLITSIYDKTARREVLPAGARANLLQLFEDRPNDADAWDVDFYYRDKGEDLTALSGVRVAEAGPLRGMLTLVREFGASRLDQDLIVYAHTPRVDFRTRVSWHEDQRLLKVAFPVDIVTDHATYEIQFGHLRRPAHFNTSWDFGKFEVPAQKWADLSEGDYGVALLNDCKYGYDCHFGQLRLSLLRATTDPDPNADRGDHEFTYALLPHRGDHRSGVVRAGYELNVPLRAHPVEASPGELPAKHRFLTVGAPNVVIEAVKKAERADELIVRLYEAHQQRGPVSVTTSLPLSQAWECNLLEERTGRERRLTGGRLRLGVKPFEIRTLALR